jgi:hypothetical protein
MLYNTSCNNMKRAVLFLLTSIGLLCLTALPIRATNFLTDELPPEISTNATPNLGGYVRQTSQRVMGNLVIEGVAGTEAEALLMKNIPVAYWPSTTGGKGIAASLVDYTASLMNRPVRTSEYIADVLHNSGVVKQAYAQGIGFAGLSPILKIWKGFRNLTYFLFIIVFVIVGFMIMFRKKISSNTIVTVQEALPKMIITLLLITFSYAIAGFIIDLMYLSIYVVMALFETSGIITSWKTAVGTIFNRNIIGIGIDYFTGFTEPSGQAAEAMGQLVSQVLGGFLGRITNVVFYLIFVVAVIIAVFRTFIQLVTAYIGIIISTIFAPIQLLPNAIPGNDSFGKWLKGLFANAAVFPVACVFIVIGATISGKSLVLPSDMSASKNGLASLTQTENGGFDYDGFIPPLLYSDSVTTLNSNTSAGGDEGGGSVSSVKALIGFGMLMLLPEIVKLTKETLEVKESKAGEMALKNAGAGKEGIGAAIKAPFSLASGALFYGRQAYEAGQILNENKQTKNILKSAGNYYQRTTPGNINQLKDASGEERVIDPNLFDKDVKKTF